MVVLRRGVATLALTASVVIGCRESEYGAGTDFGLPQYWIPGEKTVNAKTSDQGGETSLVSLVFARVGVISIDAVEESTQRKLGFSFIESGDSLVVTLQLTLDQASDPHLTVQTTVGNKSFRALIVPRHSLETYTNLGFDGPRLVLRDHGKDDVCVREGEKVILSPSDRVTLWNGNSLVLAARARIVNEGDAGRFVLGTYPGGCQGWGQGGQSLAAPGGIPMDDHGQLGIMVVSSQETLVEVTLERR